LPRLAKKYKVLYDTLVSIYSQKYQELTRRTLPRHQKHENMAKYYERYMKGDSVVDIAEDINLAPCLLARLILQCHLMGSSSSPGPSNIKTQANKRIKDPSLINDERLKREVKDCIQFDDNYSPLVEKIRRTTGIEYEFILQEKLKNLGIAFTDEVALRTMGYPKTPDIKLDVPIVVEGCGINWIESKASFGDEYTHNRYLKNSFGDTVTGMGQD